MKWRSARRRVSAKAGGREEKVSGSVLNLIGGRFRPGANRENRWVGRQRKRAVALAACLLIGVGLLVAAFRPAPGVAVLTYHDVGYPEEEYRISPERLVEHLDTLRQQGYTFLPLETLADFLAGHYPAPSKAVVLTFDDGYASFYHRVYPILRARGLPAAVFIITGDAGKGNRLSWEQMREMERDARAHIRFYAHAHQGHELIDSDGDGAPDARFYAARKWLPDKGRRETAAEYQERLSRDLRAAQAAIRLHLGHDSPYFALPGGSWSRELVRVARAEGYRYVFASAQGKRVQSGWYAYRLPRLDAGSIRPDGRGLTGPELVEMLARRDLRGNLNRALFGGRLP
ncbi:MAG: polysaccharide deacetylase family protein [Moorellales bacterium]